MSGKDDWPVLRCYSGEALRRVAMPLGGIGCGNVALTGNGRLDSWEVRNRPERAFRPAYSFFALRVAAEGLAPVTRALEGQVDPSDFEGPFGSPAPLAGLPRFRHARFEAAFPLGQVILDDPDLPVEVRLQAFSPFVPTDAEASGYPAAVLRYLVTNHHPGALQVSIAASLDNFTGPGGVSRLGLAAAADSGLRNEVRRSGPVTAVVATCPGTDTGDPDFGSLVLGLLDARQPSFRTGWPVRSWGDSLLDYWDDFSSDGELGQNAGAPADHEGRVDRDASELRAPIIGLADTRTVEPGDTATFTFILSWYFPNRRAWKGGPVAGTDHDGWSDDMVGNYYATRFAGAWEVTTDLVTQREELEARTVAFPAAFCRSDLPDAVKEAALFNLSTLCTETCFRSADGRFYGWEGIGDDRGSCFGSCTHVWNYEQATAFLFGSLARSMREVEFAYATDERGLMSFRVSLPLDKNATAWKLAAADGQMGCLVKLYRDWRLSGDDELLRSLWPHARRALAFAWIPGGWDGDQDGVFEGAQHNTMDVEYYGPNPQMESWYLAALRASEEMARYLGEDDLAVRCRQLFERGRAWTDQHLFTGRYYRHQVRPPGRADAVAGGLRHRGSPDTDLVDPQLQLAGGCLVDQLVGQVLAWITGLGDLLDAAHVRTAFEAVYRSNRRAPLAGHFNHLRTFALGDETALVMADYPSDVERPARPFPYFNEVMTGFEYTEAAGLAYEGDLERALSVIEAVRQRYDGRRRNPFDEAECGRHYARAMASWAAVLAWSRFHYDAYSQLMRLRAEDGLLTWSTGDAWGIWERQGQTASFAVMEGTLQLRRILLGDGTSLVLPRTTWHAGQGHRGKLAPAGTA